MYFDDDPVVLELDEDDKQQALLLSFEDQLTDEGAPSPSAKRKGVGGGRPDDPFLAQSRRHSTNNIPPHVADKLAQYLAGGEPPSAERSPLRRGGTDNARLPPKPFIPRPHDLRTRRASCAVLPITLGSLPEDDVLAAHRGLSLRLNRRPSAQVLPPIDSPGRDPQRAHAAAQELDGHRDAKARCQTGSQFCGPASAAHGQQTDRESELLCERGTQTELASF